MSWSDAAWPQIMPARLHDVSFPSPFPADLDGKPAGCQGRVVLQIADTSFDFAEVTENGNVAIEKSDCSPKPRAKPLLLTDSERPHAATSNY